MNPLAKRLAPKALILGAVAAAVLAGSPVQVAAWGSTGHRLVGVAAIRALPSELPAFLRTPDAAAEVGELSREPDRSKGAGQPHDRERDTAHFVDLDEAGHVLGAANVTIDNLPRLKSEYDAKLQADGIKVDDAGYLPYAIMDGWQQLKQDFAYWRVLDAAERRETDQAKRAWYREDKARRETLILRDIGYLSHYIGDGAQPLHLSIHYNGWGDYPNPNGYTNSRQTHGLFEGGYVGRHVRLDAVEAAMTPTRVAADGLNGFTIQTDTVSYLRTGLTQVIPFYELEKARGFTEGDARGVTFATERVAAGASQLRDLITLAWRAAGEVSIGWPAVKVAEVETGAADPWLSMIGED
jgi:hypothetical protein